MSCEPDLILIDDDEVTVIVTETTAPGPQGPPGPAIPGPAGPPGPQGEPGDAMIDPGDLTLIFENHLI